MSGEWTVERLDAARAKVLHDIIAKEFNIIRRWEIASSAERAGGLADAAAIRAADEAAGLPTQALLDVLNGKAVIVPVEPTPEMLNIIQVESDYMGADDYPDVYAQLLSASPYLEKPND